MLRMCPRILAERSDDEVLDDLVDRAPMIAPIFADGGGRCRDHCQLEAGYDHDVLSAEPPRVVRLAAGHIPYPPPVSVLAAADARPPARLERVLDERVRQDLAAAGLPAVSIQLAERQHLARRHQHVVR